MAFTGSVRQDRCSATAGFLCSQRGLNSDRADNLHIWKIQGMLPSRTKGSIIQCQNFGSHAAAGGLKDKFIPVIINALTNFYTIIKASCKNVDRNYKGRLKSETLERRLKTVTP
jgi:hypothetical protein